MPTFQSNPLNPSPLHRKLKRYPALFGLPFILIMVGASFGLQSFTQTRYDLQDKKIRQASSYDTPLTTIAVTPRTAVPRRGAQTRQVKEKKLSAMAEQEWEPKRIARPRDVPEWGVPPTRLDVFPDQLPPNNAKQ
ncbi:cytochrome c oxidase assembly protein COX16-domain-containing protein [Chiua virens]|nr:cytochrome c oxidase assembly protein COX16-domain-containing protein [Chiua virens]